MPELEETTERSIACPTVPGGRRSDEGWILGREGLAVPDNAELIMRFHPVGGEDVSVLSKDFDGEKEALEQIAQSMDERHSLVLRRARYDREKAENGMVINLANIVSVRVSMKDSSTTGQYL
jgi:hypothetical protein